MSVRLKRNSLRRMDLVLHALSLISGTMIPPSALDALKAFR